MTTFRAVHVTSDVNQAQIHEPHYLVAITEAQPRTTKRC